MAALRYRWGKKKKRKTGHPKDPKDYFLSLSIRGGGVS